MSPLRSSKPKLRRSFLPHDVAKLRPGDILLYEGHGLFSAAIKAKTWSRYSHVEVYMGERLAYGARFGEGVRSRPIELCHLAAVVRPADPFDVSRAISWFNQFGVGRRYDWRGLFRFYRIGRRTDDAFFCSEFAIWLLRAGGATLFAGSYPPDLVPPGHFLSSPRGILVWDDEGGWYE